MKPMIVFAVITLLLFAFVAFAWYSKRENARMALFVERAIEKYSKDESPVALQYILLAYSTAVGPTRNQVIWWPLEIAKANCAFIDDLESREAFEARLNKIEETLSGREWTFGDSLRLRADLSPDCFTAWRRLDLTVFNRI